jgi:hypothetical protein
MDRQPIQDADPMAFTTLGESPVTQIPIGLAE